jgi:hypothetical protein
MMKENSQMSALFGGFDKKYTELPRASLGSWIW